MEGVEATVTRNEDVGGDSFVLAVESPFPDAVPGQFVQVGLEIDGARVVRHYTISSPSPEDELEFTVEVDPEGELSPELRRLDAGDVVYLDGPFGRSYYEGEEELTVLAGGPGVGPAVALAERALEDGGEAAVVYEDDEPAHRDRLEDVENHGCHLELVLQDDDLTGAVERALDEVGGQVFVYGFSDFVDRALDAADGLVEGEPKVERFD